VIRQDSVRERLDPLPVQVIPGIGRETLSHLQRHGIRTVADLRTAPAGALESVFGRSATRMRERASGLDEGPVVSEREVKSISAEETFDEDLRELADMHRELLRLTERTAARLRKNELRAGTIQVKIRQSDFTTFTRQRTLHPPADSTDKLYACARDLLSVWLREHPGARIRLLGVGGCELAASTQADLFDNPSDKGSSRLDLTVDQIRDRFGAFSLGRARTLDKDQIR
jgi:DNA polymerase-4